MNMDHSYGTEGIKAICVGAEFSSLEDFQKALSHYMQETNTLYNVAKSQCISDRHMEKVSRDKSKNGAVISKLKYSYAVFGCKHYGIVRSKGKGIRPNQKTFKTDCPSHISVYADRRQGKLVIKSAVLEHNHHLGPDMARLYPENRRALGARKHVKNLPRISRCLREVLLPLSKPGDNTARENVAMEDDTQDVISFGHSFNTTEPSRGSSFSYEEDGWGDSLEACLERLQEELACQVHACRQNDAFRGLLLQDASMMQTYSSFPEFLCVDGSVALLQTSVLIFLFAIEDSLGKSEVVAVGILLTDDDEAMRWLLTTFREQNDASSKTRVIFNNYSSDQGETLKSVFPDCRLLLNPTQCLRAWKKDIPRGVTGVTECGEDLAHHLLGRALDSSSSAEYDQAYSEMQSALPVDIFTYFTEQWHSIRDQWTLGISFGGDFMATTVKVVDGIRRRLGLRSGVHGSIPIFFRRLFIELNRLRKEYSVGMAKSLCTVTNSLGAELSEYVGCLTPYAFMLIKKQFDRIDNCKPFDFIDKSENRRGSINVPVTTCVCPFFVSVGLPCCHLFVRRRVLGLEMFDPSLCPDRWTKEYYLMVSSHRQIVEQASKPLTLFQKLGQATELASELATLLSKSTDELFFKRMRLLKQLLQHWQNDQDVILVQIERGDEGADMLVETEDVSMDMQQDDVFKLIVLDGNGDRDTPFVTKQEPITDGT